MKVRIFLCVMGTVGLAACYSLASDLTPPPGYVYSTPLPSAAPAEAMFFPFMPPNPQSGAVIYAEKCIDCHGPAGLGDGPAAAELPNPVAAIGDPALAVDRSPEDWYRVVTEGNIERYMPPFTTLSERQRWDVVAYALTLSAGPAALAEGEQVYAENCAACHGAAGDGAGSSALSVPVPDFTDQSMMAGRSLNDLIAGMAHPELGELGGLPAGLTGSQQVAAAQFIRSLTFEPAGPNAAGYPAPGIGAYPAPEIGGYPAPETGSGEPAEGEQESLEAAAGSITGQVFNLSGGEVPAGLEVTLYGFDQFEQTYTQTATVDADGLFIFESVEMPEGRAFLAAIEHQRGTYTSDVAVAGPSGVPIEFQVSIYDSTTDPSNLSIDRLHVFFEFISADTVRVAELILITNAGDTVVLPSVDGEPSLRFTLPEGATNLQFEEGELGESFVQLEEGGFGELRGISPGVSSHQILFSFDMPYNRRFALNQVIELPVSALVVLLPDTGVGVTGDALVSGGTRDIEGRAYQLYTGGGLPAGSTLPIALSGTPNLDGSAAAGSATGLKAAVMIFGLVLMVLGVWLFRRNRLREDEYELDEEEEPVPEHINAMSEDELMDAIIALDDRFKAGDLPEGAYLKQRGLLKSQLQEQLEL